MASRVGQWGLKAAAAALIVAATLFALVAVLLALSTFVGPALAFALVASVLAMAGAGIWLVTRRRRRRDGPPTDPLEAALVQLVIAAVAQYLEVEHRSRTNR